ncbi:hypothetical protein U724_12465 [Pseudomonas chlororaphis subsp. aurantiaca PB-St2]|nr:hypothetical protein U724_12465 [Pseudomonas chlororaphis subsp. aurantiaca PB-St2]
MAAIQPSESAGCASSYKEQARLKQWGAKVIQLCIEQAKSEFM